MLTEPPAGTQRAPFATFYASNWRSAVRLAHVLTGIDAVAEDLAQDAFTRVHRQWHTIANPEAYLRQSVVNACRSWHRTRGREDARIDRAHAGVETSVDLAADDLLALVDRLPYRQKAVLVLRYYQDCTEAEIADALGCRPGTVKSLAARGLAQLRKEIGQ